MHLTINIKSPEQSPNVSHMIKCHASTLFKVQLGFNGNLLILKKSVWLWEYGLKLVYKIITNYWKLLSLLVGGDKAHVQVLHKIFCWNVGFSSVYWTVCHCNSWRM